MSTISLGDQAFCGTLHADTIKYKNLDPPAGGFVDNPLTGVLKCNGQDIGAVGVQAAGGIFCDTLNYTTLDPVPVTGIRNPLQKDITCTGFSILDATKLTSGAAAITTTTGCVTANSVFSGLEQLDIVAAGLGTGDLLSGGMVSGKKLSGGTGGIEVQNGDLVVTSGANGGRSTFNGGFDAPAGSKQNHVRNIAHFTSQVKETGLELGSAGSPIITGPVGLPSYKVFTFPVDTYVLDLVCEAVDQVVLFDINTTYGKVLETYVVETIAYCIDDAGVGVIPTLVTHKVEAANVTPAGSNISCKFAFINVNAGFAQVFRIRVKLSFPR